MFQSLTGIQRLVAKANTLLSDGDVTGARDVVEKAFRRNKNAINVKILKARVHILLREFEQAKEVLLGLAENQKGGPRQLMEVATMLQTVQEDDAAINLLDHLGSSGRMPRRSFVTMMQIQRRLQRWDDALASAIKACQVGGNIPWSSFGKLMDKCNDQFLNECSKKLTDEVASGKATGYACKLLSLLNNRLGDREATLRNIHLAARHVFEKAHPDIPWQEELDALTPTFIVIGAMKCGSTTIFEQIAQHPKFVSPLEKEIQFFQFAEQDAQWYLDHFPRIPSDAGYFTGEASPGYYQFEVVDRIKNLLPNVKLIFVSRNPAKRAISHLRHNNKLGMSGSGLEIVIDGIDELQAELCENSDSAEERLLHFINGPRPGNSYLSMGCYELLLRRWYRHFGESQLLHVTLEDYQADSQAVMNRVFDYLGVDAFPIKQMASNANKYISTDPETLRVTERLTEFYSAIEKSTRL